MLPAGPRKRTTNGTFEILVTELAFSPPFIRPLHADVIFLLPWDEVPEAYNRWVTIRSARVFSNRVLGSDALYKYTVEDEQDAKATLERMEQQVEQANILTDGRNYYPFPTYQPAAGLATRRISSGLRL